MIGIDLQMKLGSRLAAFFVSSKETLCFAMFMS